MRIKFHPFPEKIPMTKSIGSGFLQRIELNLALFLLEVFLFIESILEKSLDIETLWVVYSLY